MYTLPAAHREFNQLLKPHTDALKRTALRMAKNESDADDLFQETMYKAYRSFNQFEKDTNFRAWVFRILVNTFITAYRKMRRQPQRVDFNDVNAIHEQADNYDVEYSVEEEIMGKNFSDEVTRALERLPYHFKLIVMLYDIEGFSYNEIADIANVPLGTVMSRLHRGRSLLHRYLHGYAKKYNHLGDDEQEKNLANSNIAQNA